MATVPSTVRTARATSRPTGPLPAVALPIGG